MGTVLDSVSQDELCNSSGCSQVVFQTMHCKEKGPSVRINYYAIFAAVTPPVVRRRRPESTCTQAMIGKDCPSKYDMPGTWVRKAWLFGSFLTRRYPYLTLYLLPLFVSFRTEGRGNEHPMLGLPNFL